jgi:hypothetical protein
MNVVMETPEIGGIAYTVMQYGAHGADVACPEPFYSWGVPLQPGDTLLGALERSLQGACLQDIHACLWVLMHSLALDGLTYLC